MKRTLFPAAVLFAVSSASAAITPERGTYGLNSLVGNEVFTQDTVIDSSTGHYDAVLCIGTYSGEGLLTLEENVTLTLPNAVTIGGKGYSMPKDTAHNGSMVIKKGAVLQVGAKATSSGGHHVDVGNSGFPIEGHLLVDGGTVLTGQFLIGQDAGSGTATITNGGVVNLSWDGITPQKNPANDQIGLTMGSAGGKGNLIIDNGTLTDTTGTNAFLGAGGDATVELKNGAVFESNSDVWMGDIWNGAYGKGVGTDTLTVQAGSSFSCNMLWADKASAITTDGVLTMRDEMYLLGGKLTNGGVVQAEYVEVARGASVSNSGTIHADTLGIYTGTSFDNKGTLDVGHIAIRGESVTNSGTMGTEDGVSDIYLGALDNTGTIQGKAVVIGSESTLITGTLVVSGCETAMNPDHAMQTDYATGIADGTAVVLEPRGTQALTNVTVGARVNGGDTMQYLYSADFRALDAKVLDALNLQVVTEFDEKGIVSAWEALTEKHADKLNVRVANIIGDNISANVTTDDAHDSGDITVALSGSHLVVRVGDNGVSDPSAEDRKASAEKVGTLGSYREDVAETEASVRLHTTASQSAVDWEGHYMETVATETAHINDSTVVSVGSAGVDGTLTVVEKSTLQNEGQVKTDTVVVNGTMANVGKVTSDKVEVNGTLDNNGHVTAATVVNEGGTLKGSGTMAKTTLTFGASFIVGNSPGVTTFTDDFKAEAGSETVFSVAGWDPATEAQKGWNTPTYSQVVIAGAETTATLEADARVVIAFGGEYLFSSASPLYTEQQTEFELVLIRGGMADDGTDLVALLNNTTFMITKESLGQPRPEENIIWHLHVADARYSIEESNLILRGTLGITRAPEPATATLSLLALAALASRRRRK